MVQLDVLGNVPKPMAFVGAMFFTIAAFFHGAFHIFILSALVTAVLFSLLAGAPSFIKLMKDRRCNKGK